MKRDWNGFIEAVDKNPKEFVRAVVDYLSPPEYAKRGLRRVSFLCDWPGCWKRSVDLCFKCSMSVCEEHSEKFIGPKTKLEWYVCKGCLANTPREEILREIGKQDEEILLEFGEIEEASGR